MENTRTLPGPQEAQGKPFLLQWSLQQVNSSSLSLSVPWCKRATTMPSDEGPRNKKQEVMPRGQRLAHGWCPIMGRCHLYVIDRNPVPASDSFALCCPLMFFCIGEAEGRSQLVMTLVGRRTSICQIRTLSEPWDCCHSPCLLSVSLLGDKFYGRQLWPPSRELENGSTVLLQLGKCRR